MPTGYTAAIKDGISFNEYALSCARAFGALIMMRDEPADAPIPDEFKPSDYHFKKIEEAKAELARLRAMSPDEAVSQIRKSIDFDCNDSYYHETEVVRLCGQKWLRGEIKRINGSIEYHTEAAAKEAERARSATEWIRALRRSLEA